MPLCEDGGEKVISLISRYHERFPEACALARTLTPFVYGDPYVRDIDALQEAKWLLHIKPNGGFVCNAVTKALACGVPVLMDEDTWENGFFTNCVRHNHNGIVVPASQLEGVLNDLSTADYDRIKSTCVSEAVLFSKRSIQNDGWWEDRASIGRGAAPGAHRLLKRCRSFVSRLTGLGGRSAPRLSLSELDAIPYLTEDGTTLNPHVWERSEQIDAQRFVRSDHRVLELGGCYGLVSCVINHNLQTQTHHVVVEPASQVISALTQNRDSHHAGFQIFNGVVARDPMVIRGEGISRWTEPSSSSEITHVTAEELEQRYNMTFNCLVADCEGAMGQFVRDFPTFFDTLDTVLYERDREWDDSGSQCDYAIIERFLGDRGFQQIKSGSHSVWVR